MPVEDYNISGIQYAIQECCHFGKAGNEPSFGFCLWIKWALDQSPDKRSRDQSENRMAQSFSLTSMLGSGDNLWQ